MNREDISDDNGNVLNNFFVGIITDLEKKGYQYSVGWDSPRTVFVSSKGYDNTFRISYNEQNSVLFNCYGRPIGAQRARLEEVMPYFFPGKSFIFFPHDGKDIMLVVDDAGYEAYAYYSAWGIRIVYNGRPYILTNERNRKGYWERCEKIHLPLTKDIQKKIAYRNGAKPKSENKYRVNVW